MHKFTGPVIWFQWARDIHIKGPGLWQDVTTDWQREIDIYDGVFFMCCQQLNNWRMDNMGLWIVVNVHSMFYQI